MASGTNTLYPYQEQGVEFLRSHNRAYLGDEMGLGKSAQLVRASRGRTLVVAPAMLIDSGNWQREIDRWADDPSRFSLASYSKLAARKGRQVLGRARPEYLEDFETVVFDEAHYIKNPKVARTKAAIQIAKNAPNVYLASGTPVPNWAHELFVPLQLLHPEEARTGMEFGSYWRWVGNWFRVSDSPYNRGAMEIGLLKGCSPKCLRRSPDDPCEHYAVFSQANLRGKMLRRLRDDVLEDLPELQHHRVAVPMATKQWTEYKRMRDEYLAEVADDLVVAWSGAARHSHLDRITTSLGMLSGTPMQQSGKFDRLAQDLSERTRPTVVVAHFRDSVEACAEVARSLGKTVGTIHGGTPKASRANIVSEFQEGRVDVLCGSYETISEGLTLTAADTMILVELSYKAARNQQAIRRIHRIGQDRGCMVLEYYATGPRGQQTLDSSKRRLVDDKIAASGMALTAAQLKEYL